MRNIPVRNRHHFKIGVEETTRAYLVGGVHLQTKVFVKQIVFAEHIPLSVREDGHHLDSRTQVSAVIQRLVAVAEDDGVIDPDIAVQHPSCRQRAMTNDQLRIIQRLFIIRF